MYLNEYRGKGRLPDAAAGRRVASLLFRALMLFVLVCVGLALLTGCGGGSGSDSDTNSTAGGPGSTVTTTGEVALLITDAPADEFDEVNVTITEVRLLGDNEEGEGDEDAGVVIFTGERTIDLLELQDYSELFSLAEVPAGTYEKIRLEVSEITLVRRDEAGAVIEEINPRLPSGRIELNPRRRFEMEAEQTLFLQVDLDVRRSVKIVETGNGGYIFRPVVFVDFPSEHVRARFTKVDGTISEVDETAQTFRLCGAFGRMDGDEQDQDCLLTGVGEDTTVFTANGAGGFADIVVDEPATVFARLRRDDGELLLDARLVYVGDAGDLARVRGGVESGYDDESGTFEISIFRSPAFERDEIITAGLLDGAKVLSRGGVVLEPGDITAGARIWLLGVLNDDTTDIDAFVVFHSGEAVETGMRSGVVSAVDPDTGTFVLLPSPDGNISSDTLICLDDDTNLYLIDGSSSSAITLEQLHEDDTADVYGRLKINGCFDAETVLAFPASDEGDIT